MSRLHTALLAAGLASCTYEDINKGQDTAITGGDTDTDTLPPSETALVRNEILATILEHAAGEAPDQGVDDKFCLKLDSGAAYDSPCPSAMAGGEAGFRESAARFALGEAGTWNDLLNFSGAVDWTLAVSCFPANAPWPAIDLTLMLPADAAPVDQLILSVSSGYNLFHLDEMNRYISASGYRGDGVDRFTQPELFLPSLTSRYYVSPPLEDGAEPELAYHVSVREEEGSYENEWRRSVGPVPPAVNLDGILEIQNNWVEAFGNIAVRLAAGDAPRGPLCPPNGANNGFTASGTF